MRAIEGEIELLEQDLRREEIQRQCPIPRCHRYMEGRLRALRSILDALKGTRDGRTSG
jgi:hypothetical protein